MGLALLFPGQGTQYPGMLHWIEQEPAAAGVLQELERQLGVDWRNRVADAAIASRNEIAQPLIVGVELAAWACLAPLLPRAVAVAGYSVGELSAFAAAGIFDSTTALAASRVRARAMNASTRRPTTLLAVRDVESRAFDAWCERHGLALAIRLGQDRAIVGGTVAAVAAARDDPAVAGRASSLAVNVASHTPWMHKAAAQLARYLAGVTLRRPGPAVVCNLTGAASSQPQELARCLAEQVAQPVLWDTCMETLAERRVSCVLEVGPGTSLSSMWRAFRPDIPARSADEFRSAAAAAHWVAKTVDADR